MIKGHKIHCTPPTITYWLAKKAKDTRTITNRNASRDSMRWYKLTWAWTILQKDSKKVWTDSNVNCKTCMRNQHVTPAPIAWREGLAGGSPLAETSCPPPPHFDNVINQTLLNVLAPTTWKCLVQKTSPSVPLHFC